MGQHRGHKPDNRLRVFQADGGRSVSDDEIGVDPRRLGQPFVPGPNGRQVLLDH
jgi:hypothetical protein